VTLRTQYLDLDEAFREITTLELVKGIYPEGFVAYTCLAYPDSGKVRRDPGSLHLPETPSIHLGSPSDRSSLHLPSLLDLAKC
jgi:hypothetical protein